MRERMETTGDVADDLRIYASAENTDASPTRWRIISDQEITRATRYCYWSAARPLFLRRAQFDYSAFPDVERLAFELKPRLGRRMTVGRHDDLGVIELEVGSWVSPGNAVELTWQERAG